MGSKKLLRNNKGMGLIGIMIAATSGLIAVAGISKALVGFSEKTNKIASKRNYYEVKSNVNSMLRNLNSWKKTLAKHQERLPGSDCYPGGKYFSEEGEEERCSFDFYYQRGTRDSDIQKWACSVAHNKAAVAFFNKAGNYINMDAEEDVDPCELARCLENANHPSNSHHCSEEMLKNAKYLQSAIKAKIELPEGIESILKSSPNFKVTLTDSAGSKSIETFYVMRNMNLEEESSTGFAMLIERQGKNEASATNGDARWDNGTGSYAGYNEDGWKRRTLNEVTYNDIGATLNTADSTFTLKPGTYVININARVYSEAQYSTLALYEIPTISEPIERGHDSMVFDTGHATDGGPKLFHVRTVLTITEDTRYEIKQYHSSYGNASWLSTNDRGNSNLDEIHINVGIRKLK